MGLLLICCSTAHSYIIVWDLVDVLFEVHKAKIGMHIVNKATGGNIWSLFKMAAHVPTETQIKKMMKDVLDKIDPQPCRIKMRDDNGDYVSEVFCEYLACQISSQRLLHKIHESIRQLDAEGYFKTPLQKKLITSTLETVFTPELYAHYMAPIKKGIALVKLCAEKKNSKGKLMNQLMVLSNWDCESFSYLLQKKTSQKVFQYFKKENVFISGQFDMLEGLKPCQWVFNYLIDYKNLKPSDFILIDNSAENVAAARKCGMRAIQLRKRNYAEVETELRKLGAL